MAEPQIVFIVHGPGVRFGRRSLLHRQDERIRQGRQQICVEVFRNRDLDGPVSRPQWLDAGLIFASEERARNAYRRASQHAATRDLTVREACILLCLSAAA